MSTNQNLLAFTNTDGLETRQGKLDVATLGTFRVQFPNKATMRLIEKEYGKEIPEDARYHLMSLIFQAPNSAPVTIFPAGFFVPGDKDRYFHSILTEKDLGGRRAENGRLTERFASALGLGDANYAQVIEALVKNGYVTADGDTDPLGKGKPALAGVFYPSEGDKFEAIFPLSRHAAESLAKRAEAAGGVVPELRSERKKPKGGAAKAGDTSAAKEDTVE